MDKRYRHLLRATLAALPLACAAVLSSCAFDDDVAECPDPNAPATVRVSVSAGEPGDLNGTRAGDDVNADEHEFMHTLRLYIVNDNDNGVRRTVLDLSPDLTNNTLAQTGDLTNYETGELTLAPGTYTIYAFANVDGYNGEFGTESGQRAITQMTMTEFLDDCFAIDQQVRDGDLAEYRIYNPAKNLDFANKKYIPMSAKKTITVTPNTSDISIGLDRLVSKVKITVPEDKQYISTNSTIQFSDYAENVPLLGADGGYGSAELYGKRTAASKAMPFYPPGDVVSFYVNETYTGDPFTVTLSTGKSGNGDVSAYVAKTQRTDIPRNSIYPLSLTFPNFTPQFEWQSWEAAIGAVPVEVVVEENNYIVNIASGNTFKFTVNGVNGTNSQLQSATWAHGDVTNQITDIQIGNNAISGAISAGVPVGTPIPLTVTVNWTADYTDAKGSTEPRNFTRTYNVTIETIDIWDTKYKSSTRSGSWRAYRLTPEVLNMFIKR